MLKRIKKLKGIKELNKKDLTAISGGGLNSWDCMTTNGQHFFMTHKYYAGQTIFGLTVEHCTPVGEASTPKKGDYTVAGN